MRRFRPRLSYANVVATLALFLALSGGAVWAASKIKSNQIGKGAVKNKNLAKNAVKAKNLAGKSVTTAKIADGSVTNPKLGDGAVNFAKIAAGTSVIASSTAGPIAANQDGPVSVPLNPPLTVTPVAGQPITINLEAHGNLTQTGASSCDAVVLPFVNGGFLELGELFGLESPDVPPDTPPFEKGIPQAVITFPVGLTQPGTPQSITLEMFGDATECTAGSTVNVAVVATQAK